jgi:hypothetical protein
VLFGLAILAVGAGWAVALADLDLFYSWYAWEDGPVESLTVAVLVFGGAALIVRAKRAGNRAVRVVSILAAITLFLAAGEELSWGQRIFGVETPEFFAEHNAQGETNFHNLRIGGVNVNKLVFSQLLTVGTVAFLVVLPALYGWRPAFARLVDRWAVPVPRWRHVALALVGVGVGSLIPSISRWELTETVMVIVLVLALVWPVNPGATRLEGRDDDATPVQ